MVTGLRSMAHLCTVIADGIENEEITESPRPLLMAIASALPHVTVTTIEPHEKTAPICCELTRRCFRL
jgi:hypothetical protein